MRSLRTWVQTIQRQAAVRCDHIRRVAGRLLVEDACLEIAFSIVVCLEMLLIRHAIYKGESSQTSKLNESSAIEVVIFVC